MNGTARSTVGVSISCIPVQRRDPNVGWDPCLVLDEAVQGNCHRRETRGQPSHSHITARLPYISGEPKLAKFGRACCLESSDKAPHWPINRVRYHGGGRGAGTPGPGLQEPVSPVAPACRILRFSAISETPTFCPERVQTCKRAPSLCGSRLEE